MYQGPNYKEQHQDRLADLIRAARKRGGSMMSTTYYVGGYCNNSRCDIRDVVMRVKDHNDGPIREIRCPACRSLLLFGAHSFNVEMMTIGEYEQQGDADARDSVAAQLVRESHGDGLLTIAQAAPRGTTLDDLAVAFAKRD